MSLLFAIGGFLRVIVGLVGIYFGFAFLQHSGVDPTYLWHYEKGGNL